MKRGADRSPEHNNKHNLVLGKTKEVFVGVFSLSLCLPPSLSLSIDPASGERDDTAH